MKNRGYYKRTVQNFHFLSSDSNAASIKEQVSICESTIFFLVNSDVGICP